MNSLTQILLTKAQQQKLAHFYLVRAAQSEPNPDIHLKEWMEEFLVNFIAQEKKCDLITAKRIFQFDVADILWLQKNPDHNNFLTEDLTPLFNFIELRPFEFSTKIAVVNQAELIVKKTSNKLLKLLEEPTDNSVIFFLYGGHNRPLATIESRAINLYLPSSQNQQNSLWDESEAANLLKSFMMQEKSLTEILEILSKKRDLESEVMAKLRLLLTHSNSSYSLLNQAIDLLRQYEQDTILNMPLKTRILPLLLIAQKVYHAST